LPGACLALATSLPPSSLLTVVLPWRRACRHRRYLPLSCLGDEPAAIAVTYRFASVLLAEICECVAVATSVRAR